jgi:TusA-related sulfurtransferase
MSRLSQGEREFVSDFGELPGTTPQPATAPMPAPQAGGVREIDARPLAPPLPLLEAHRALRTMRAGEEARVITGYPGSMAEFQALAKYDTRLDLVSQDVAGDVFVHLLRKRR